MKGRTARRMADTALGVVPEAVLRRLLGRLAQTRTDLLLEALGTPLSRDAQLAAVPYDGDPVPGDGLRFEHLAGLFANTSANHGVVALTIRQAAYLYHVARTLPAKKAVEIGRYKGGSTLILAGAMGRGADLWSIDIGEKEARHRRADAFPPYDDQLRSALGRLGLHAHLLVGDSRTLEIDTGPLDLAFIDGDHSYEGVRADFERWGRRVRVGGAVLLDDAASDGFVPSHDATVGRVVKEAVATGDFRLVKHVVRTAHLERVR